MKTQIGKNPVNVDSQGFFGMPGRIRTCDLQSRSLTLYPTELRALNARYFIPSAAECQGQTFVQYRIFSASAALAKGPGIVSIPLWFPK